MQVTKLRLENFGCHEELEVELTAGICGILGGNGTGKSTILDAIRFGLTGDFAAEGSKSDNVAWGEETATVTVEFEHGDGIYAIKRSFGKRNSQQLVTPEETLTRKGEIQAFVEGICGTSIDALLNNVFVPQGRIDSILFSTNTARLKEIQQTVGLHRASEAEKALGNEGSRYQVTVGLEAQLQLAEETLAEVEDNYAQVSAEKAELEVELTELRPYRELLDRTEEQKRASVAIQQADARIDKVARALADAVNTLEQTTQKRNTLQQMQLDTKDAAESARAAIAQHDADKLALQATQQLQQQLTEAQQSLTKLGDAPEGDPEALKNELSELTEKLDKRKAMQHDPSLRPPFPARDEVVARIEELTEMATAVISDISTKEVQVEFRKSELEKQLDALVSESVCPTCGQDIGPGLAEQTRADLATATAELEALRAEQQAKVVPLRQERDEKAKVLQDMTEAANAAIRGSIEKLNSKILETRQSLDMLTTYAQSSENLAARVEMLERQIKTSTPTPLNAEEVERLRIQVSDHDKIAISVAELSSSVNANVSAVEQLETYLEEARRARSELGETGDVASEEAIEEAKAKVEILSARTKSLAEVDRRLISLEMQLKQYGAQLESLRKQIEVESRDAAWVKLCSRAREVLHVKGLPSLLMREYAHILNQRLRYYLGIWEADFTLELDENLAFVATFEDGRVLSGARLSGGQKIVASTSFRLAMADTFARQVGLLILDEPSNHLDRDNVVHLQQLLIKLKELAGASGRQVIMVDHEESLVGFFDHVVTLTPQES